MFKKLIAKSNLNNPCTTAYMVDRPRFSLPDLVVSASSRHAPRDKVTTFTILRKTAFSGSVVKTGIYRNGTKLADIAVGSEISILVPKGKGLFKFEHNAKSLIPLEIELDLQGPTTATLEFPLFGTKVTFTDPCEGTTPQNRLSFDSEERFWLMGFVNTFFPERRVYYL